MQKFFKTRPCPAAKEAIDSAVQSLRATVSRVDFDDVDLGRDFDKLVRWADALAEKAGAACRHPGDIGGDWAIPESLDLEGRALAEAVARFCQVNDMTFTGGCKVFYSPQEWRDRGEDYGTESVLVICHDGGDHGRICCWEREDYKMIEKFQEFMKDHGYFCEQCTCWYSAIYRS